MKQYDYIIAIGENVITCRYWPKDHFAEDICFDQVDAEELYVRDGDKFMPLIEKVSRLAHEHYLEDIDRHASERDGSIEAAAEARRD